jgi:tetratricopeptide (TPR) repeat protein
MIEGQDKLRRVRERRNEVARANATMPFERIQKDLGRGNLLEAADAIAKRLAAAPDDAGALTAHGQLLRLTDRLDAAQATVDLALAIAPGFAPAMVELARLALRANRLGDAHAWYERAHQSSPDATQWFDEWCETLHAMKRFDLGLAVAQQWCDMAPDDTDAWFRLGLFRQASRLYLPARQAYEQAFGLDPARPLLRNNLSALHYQLGDHAAALRLGMEATRSGSDTHLAWTNVSNVLLATRKPARAELAARRACALAPGYTLALLALSNALKEMQSWDEAYEMIVRAARAPGSDATIQWAVAMLQLIRGDFLNGWINFEARWSGSPELEQVPDFYPELRWHGQHLTGKTLMVWGEQGFGDVFQFTRFVPALAARVREAGGQMTVCCFAKVFPLIQRSFADCGVKIVPHDSAEPFAFDYHVPLGSLPLILGTTLETLPSPAMYLRHDEARSAAWSERLANGRRLRVGLAWSGSRTHQRNPLRSVPPELYARALRDLSDVDFYSLQIDGADDVARMVRDGLKLIDLTGELSSFDETAAFIASLDLVVTVCTSVAHLAGALGKPTWLLLDVNPHWTWLLERSDSPWYPSVALYRQRQYQDWSEPLRKVGVDLARLLSGRGDLGGRQDE